MDIDKIKAVCFDLGNTLIEFGPKQVLRLYTLLEKALTEMFGSCDEARLKAIRDRQITAPFRNGFKEDDLSALCKELIQGLYNITPDQHQVDKLVQVRYESFVHVIELPDGVLTLLEKLRQRYRIGLLSNYPCGRSIRDSLEKIGLSNMFESIVVSGEVGYVKPHARPFETLLSYMGLSPSDCVYIGDNWLADVQGCQADGHAVCLHYPVCPLRKV